LSARFGPSGLALSTPPGFARRLLSFSQHKEKLKC
jgi:hypothetical protein